MVIFPTIRLLRTIQDQLLSLPEVDGVGGYRLLLFEGFIVELREQFGFNGHLSSSLERDLLIGQVLDELDEAASLNYLNRIPFTFNYRQALLDGIAEWKRAGLTPELFREWAFDQGIRAQELALVYAAYQEKLVDYGFAENDLTLEEFQLLRLDGFQNAQPSPVLLYGFNDLTPLQTDFIKALEPWFNFEAIVDPTAVPEFQRFTRRFFSYSKIDGEGGVSQPETALRQLKHHLWLEDPNPLTLVPEDTSLQVIQAAGPSLAVAIAREVRQLLQSATGYDVDDFLIVAPRPEIFIQHYEAVFDQYQLSLSHQSLAVGEATLTGHFRQMLQVILEDWQWPGLKILMHHYYKGQLAETGDRLLLWLAENYGAISGKTRWLKWLTDPGFIHEAAKREISLQPLEAGIKWLAEFPETAEIRHYLHLTYQWFHAQSGLGLENVHLEDMAVRAELRNYQAARQIIQTIEGIFNSDGRLIDISRQLTLSEFKVWFEEFLVADQTITDEAYGRRMLSVVSPEEVRGITAKIVLITGLEQGVFPRVYINDWKLDAKARWDLKMIGIELEQADTHQLQEKLAFYWGVRAATVRLYLIYQDQNADGQIANRSSFLNEVLHWFPKLAEGIRCYPLEPTVSAGFSQCCADHEFRQLWVAYSVQSRNSMEAEELRGYEAFLRDQTYQSMAAGVRHWLSGTTPGLDGVSDQTPYLRQWLARRFGREVSLGITAVEDYLACPYRFFLKYLLKIRTLPAESLLPAAVDLGQFYHQVLADFCDHYRDQRFTRDNFDQYLIYLEGLIQAQLGAWQSAAANDLVRAVLAAEEEQIRKTLRRWLLAEIEWAKLTDNRFRPHATELEFGETAAPEGTGALRLAGDQFQMLISGRIDRLDSDDAGNFIVYDYKLGRGPSASDILDAKKLQLPIYLLAVEQGLFSAGKGLGGAYLGLKAPSRSSGGIWRKEALNIVWRSKNALNHSEWEEWLERTKAVLIAAGRGISQGQFRLTEENCPDYCEYAGCCRRQEWEVERFGAKTQ